MRSIWRKLRQWGREEQASSSSHPFVHEVITRSDAEQEAYRRWRQSPVCRLLIEWINRQYQLFLLQPEQIDDSISFLQTPSSNGFVIHFSTLNYTAAEAMYTFDLFKERILESLQYKPSLSDVRKFRKSGTVEEVQRYYLKPRIQIQDGQKINQQFGNVTIEYIARDDRPYQLKISATRYSDRMYTEGRDFGGLFEVLVDLRA